MVSSSRQVSLARDTITNPPTARQTRGPRHARGCHGRLCVLHRLGTSHGNEPRSLFFSLRPTTPQATELRAFAFSNLNVTYLPALCRLGPPAAELLPAARVGHPHTRHPDPPRLGRRRFLPQRCHDPKQPEEGCQGEGGSGQEEGVRSRGGYKKERNEMGIRES